MKRRRKRLSVLILVFTFLFGMSGIGMANSQQDLSPLTPQQQEAYNYLSSLPPGWLSLIADEFGIAESELIPLYKSGMNYGQIRSCLLELYPVPEISFSYEDCAELAAQTGIDELDAITCYDMAYKWRKDPVWLADLFQRTGSWDIVESAFERWEQSSEKPSSNISTRSIMSMASSPSQIDKVYEVYNVSAQSVDSMMRSGADVNDVRNILFFMDITSAEDQLNATAENSLISAVPFSSSPSLYIDINASLEEGWIDELPEEINYLNESWPKREFPQELLPLLSDTNENLLTRSVNMESSDLSMNLAIPQLTFADSELSSQSSFFSNPTGLQPEITPSAASSDSDVQYSSRGLNIETMYGEDKASPFKSYFTGTSERINPHSGTLLITVNDFSLDEKLGPDFNFTRYFNGSQNVLEQVSVTTTQGTRSVSSGTTQNSYLKETEYQDGSKRKDVTTVNFEYDAQTTDNGYVNGTAEVENTAYFYRQGETTPYAVKSEDTYSGEAYMLPASASVTAASSVSIKSVPATYDKDIFGFGHGWGIDGIPVMDIEGSKKYITLGSEGTYEVGSDGFLVGRDSHDMWVEDPRLIYKDIESPYALKNINNETWYFNAKGNPFLLIGNQIASIISPLLINYNSSDKVSEIIDSVGRSIRFTHGTNSVTVDVYESSSSTVSLQRWIYNTEPSSVAGKNKLVSVVQPSGQQIFYQYNEYLKPYEFKYNNTNYSHNLKYLNLTSITQPTSLVTNFLYKANDNIIMERYDEVPTYTVNSNSVLTNTSQENRALFSYLTNVTTKTLQRSNGEQGTVPATETWEYDSNDRLIKHKIVGNNSGADRNSAETVETLYTYSSAKSQRPSSIKTITKLDNTSIISETTESFAYDSYGNIVSHVDTSGNRTDYIYDNLLLDSGLSIAPEYAGCNNLIEKMEYLTYSPTLYTGRRTKYALSTDGRDVVAEEVAMIEKRQTGTKTYYAPTGEVPDKERSPYAYIWTPSEIITSATLNIYWTTCGWGIDNQYAVEYRKSGTTTWIQYYLSPYKDGGLFSTTGTRTTTINFPSPDIYEIRVREIEGDCEIKSGSVATGPVYTTTNLSDVLYKSYEYDSKNPGNITAINLYPAGSTSGTPETRTTYTYDTLWHLYPVESVTQFTRADGSVGTVKQTMTYDNWEERCHQRAKRLEFQAVRLSTSTMPWAE